MADEQYNKNRDTELILPPGVFAFVQDETKGKVNTLTGPYKTSLSNTDRLVTYNSQTKRFDTATKDQAIQTCVIAPKGHYIILENPSGNSKQPESGKQEDLISLRMGQTENIPGPVSFSLWPGQTATVIPGHHLRSNQYLLVRVTDDEAAKANWDKTVVKTTTSDVSKSEEQRPSAIIGVDAAKKILAPADTVPPIRESSSVLTINKDSLVTGQILVIKGTEVAFYIPATGVEVLRDENNLYVRDAVTLERLEYSILLDEDGNKEYVRGPAVVFPEPTQQFVTRISKS